MSVALNKSLVRSPFLPFVSWVRVSDQSLTAHLRCIQHRRANAVSSIRVTLVVHHEAMATAFQVLVILTDAAAALALNAAQC